jgi:hypothetical protein
MKRRFFLIGLGLIFQTILTSCKKDELPLTTIFTGHVIDENNQPAVGVGFIFFSDRKEFFKETYSDSEGYFYLEGTVLSGAGLIDFNVISGRNSEYTDGLYKRLCLVNGIYQDIIPWTYGKKNDLKFKVVKR